MIWCMWSIHIGMHIGHMCHISYICIYNVYVIGKEEKMGEEEN